MNELLRDSCEQGTGNFCLLLNCAEYQLEEQPIHSECHEQVSANATGSSSQDEAQWLQFLGILIGAKIMILHVLCFCICEADGFSAIKMEFIMLAHGANNNDR